MNIRIQRCLRKSKGRDQLGLRNLGMKDIGKQEIFPLCPLFPFSLCICLILSPWFKSLVSIFQSTWQNNHCNNSQVCISSTKGRRTRPTEISYSTFPGRDIIDPMLGRFLFLLPHCNHVDCWEEVTSHRK